MEAQLELRLYEEALRTEYEKQRPSILLRPSIGLDGNRFCVLYGPNIMDGVAGFGCTADEAMRDFDMNWVTRRAPELKSARGGVS